MAVGEVEGIHGSGWETREKENIWGDNTKMEVNIPMLSICKIL